MRPIELVLVMDTAGSMAGSGKLDGAKTAACTQAKAEGIELHVTSFGAGVSTATRAKLQACAPDADNYQHASSSADLSAFFNHIGQDVLNNN